MVITVGSDRLPVGRTRNLQPSGAKHRFKTAGYMWLRAQELCKSRGGRPGLPVPNSPYGLCGRKATLNERR